jgi:hypothetical protein
MRRLTAQAGTAEAVAAQLGAIPGTQGEVVAPVGDPPPFPPLPPPTGVVVGAGGPPPDPPVGQVPPFTGELAQAHTALAEASTTGTEAAPQAEITHGAAAP